ncbi:MAG: MoaD/ThiS family protein [Desulfatirhabdiaceae bacterium]
MRIVVKPAGIIRMVVSEMALDVPPGRRLDQVIEGLRIPASLKLMVFVNGIRRDGNTVLNDGDEIRIITLMTGG